MTLRTHHSFIRFALQHTRHNSYEPWLSPRLNADVCCGYSHMMRWRRATLRYRRIRKSFEKTRKQNSAPLTSSLKLAASSATNTARISWAASPNPIVQVAQPNVAPSVGPRIAKRPSWTARMRHPADRPTTAAEVSIGATQWPRGALLRSNRNGFIRKWACLTTIWHQTRSNQWTSQPLTESPCTNIASETKKWTLTR